MIPSCYVCAVLMVSCSLEVHASRHLNVYKSTGLNTVSIEKRGIAEYLARHGQDVAEKLLKGTQQLQSPKETTMRLFQKKGSFDDAMLDFRSANPSYIWEFQDKYGEKVLQGKVGDRHLFLRSNGKTPTLDIIDYRKARVAYYGKSLHLPKVFGQPIDRIIYTPK